MFLTYLLRELSNRRKQTVVIAAGMALAIALVIGFMVHNLTEGIGIAAPAARGGSRIGLWRGLGLAVIAGVPAVLGIWLGRYVAGPLFVTMCFALAACGGVPVTIRDPKCVAKTFPDYFEVLDSVTRPARSPASA